MGRRLGRISFLGKGNLIGQRTDGCVSVISRFIARSVTIHCTQRACLSSVSDKRIPKRPSCSERLRGSSRHDGAVRPDECRNWRTLGATEHGGHAFSHDSFSHDSFSHAPLGPEPRPRARTRNTHTTLVVDSPGRHDPSSHEALGPLTQPQTQPRRHTDTSASRRGVLS